MVRSLSNPAISLSSSVSPRIPRDSSEQTTRLDYKGRNRKLVTERTRRLLRDRKHSGNSFQQKRTGVVFPSSILRREKYWYLINFREASVRSCSYFFLRESAIFHNNYPLLLLLIIHIIKLFILNCIILVTILLSSPDNSTCTVIPVPGIIPHYFHYK